MTLGRTLQSFPPTGGGWGFGLEVDVFGNRWKRWRNARSIIEIGSKSVSSMAACCPKNCEVVTLTGQNELHESAGEKILDVMAPEYDLSTLLINAQPVSNSDYVSYVAACTNGSKVKIKDRSQLWGQLWKTWVKNANKAHNAGGKTLIIWPSHSHFWRKPEVKVWVRRSK